MEDSSGQLLLDTTIPNQINRLAFQMNFLLESELKSHGFSMANWRVMAVLDHNSSASVNQLADYAMIDQSTLSRLIKRMEKQGYLENQPSQEDGRARNVVLTTAGTEKYHILREATMKHVARILHGFSPEDQRGLLDAVIRMQENVESIDLE